MDKPKSQPSLGIKLLSAGTAASVAEVATIPLDTVKVRLQIQGEGTGKQGGAKDAVHYRGVVRTLVTISREEGVRALYNGLTPGIHRQLVFASIRLGLYDNVKNFYIDLMDKDDPTHAYNPHIGLRILAGITTGALGVTCAQPTDVVKVRLQAQSKGSGPRYTGTLSAYKTIATQEGVRGLWKGILPNVTRNSMVNACELVSYDMIKETLIKKQFMSDNIFCHFVSAFSAGFVSTCIASPVDVVKTRFMNSSPGLYKGAIDCARRMYQEGGLLSFYKGFVPSFTRLGSWNIVMFISFEQLKMILGPAQQKRSHDQVSSHPRRAKVL